jgi:hypothetical protein
VEIPDGLFSEVKRYAQTHELTFRQVVETGLRKVIAEEQTPAKPFRLRDVSVGGRRMVKDFSWPEIMAIIYEGRGGE